MLTQTNIKYSVSSDCLRDAFVCFMNARHVISDYMSLEEDGHMIPQESIYKADLRMHSSHEQLVEATRFVADLANCDGAIVLSDDLKVYGFGVEIKSDFALGTKVVEVKHEYGRNHKNCDVEAFGMRHRSAIKLVSQLKNCRVLVISQDGPISAVWWERDKVSVKKGVTLANINMPLA